MIDGNLVGLNAHHDRQDKDDYECNWIKNWISESVEQAAKDLFTKGKTDTPYGVYLLSGFAESFEEYHAESGKQFNEYVADDLRAEIFTPQQAQDAFDDFHDNTGGH